MLNISIGPRNPKAFILAGINSVSSIRERKSPQSSREESFARGAVSPQRSSVLSFFSSMCQQVAHQLATMAVPLSLLAMATAPSLAQSTQKHSTKKQQAATSTAPTQKSIANLFQKSRINPPTDKELSTFAKQLPTTLDPLLKKWHSDHYRMVLYAPPKEANLLEALVIYNPAPTTRYQSSTYTKVAQEILARVKQIASESETELTEPQLVAMQDAIFHAQLPHGIAGAFTVWLRLNGDSNNPIGVELGRSHPLQPIPLEPLKNVLIRHGFATQQGDVDIVPSVQVLNSFTAAATPNIYFLQYPGSIEKIAFSEEVYDANTALKTEAGVFLSKENAFVFKAGQRPADILKVFALGFESTLKVADYVDYRNAKLKAMDNPKGLAQLLSAESLKDPERFGQESLCLYWLDPNTLKQAAPELFKAIQAAEKSLLTP